MFMQVSSNSFGQRIPQLAKALQHPPNDYQRSDAGQRIDVAQRHANLSQRIGMVQRFGTSPPICGSTCQYIAKCSNSSALMIV